VAGINGGEIYETTRAYSMKYSFLIIIIWQRSEFTKNTGSKVE